MGDQEDTGFIMSVSYNRLRRRPSNQADKAFANALNEEVYRDLAIEQFGSWDAAAQDSYFDRKWDTGAYQIIECDGAPIGVLWLQREKDHLWLREIQIQRAQQNQGLGTQLLLDVMTEAHAITLPIRLRVLKGNRALSLYERLGFRVTGEYHDTHTWMEWSPS
ncbi:MAG: GNAT family N-acetyltransferase [Pseudomonadota bacterium]